MQHSPNHSLQTEYHNCKVAIAIAPRGWTRPMGKGLSWTAAPEPRGIGCTSGGTRWGFLRLFLTVELFLQNSDRRPAAAPYPSRPWTLTASPWLQWRDGFLQDLSSEEHIFRSICCLCVSDVLDTPSSNDITAVQKAKTLYRSCINESKCPLTLLHVRYRNIIQTLPSSQSSYTYILLVSVHNFSEILCENSNVSIL